MAVTLLLVFCAVAQERDIAALRKPPDQPERELLTVVLDRRIASIHDPRRLELGAIPACEFDPGDPASLHGFQESFAGAE
jgi:hypothetical protein